MSEADRQRAALRTGGRGRVRPFRNGRLGAARLGVAACVAAATVVAVPYTGRAIARLGDKAEENATLNYDDRAFGGGNALGVDKAALWEARALIPERAGYRLLAGPGTPPELAPHLEGYVRYFLMPRRPHPRARWILCYGCDRAELPRRLRVLWDNGNGIAIGRLTG